MLQLEPSTFVFQILNFFILLAILRRFLYRPLLRVMEQRETEIAERLRSAEERARLADAERAQLAERSREFETVLVTRLEQSTAEATRERNKILERARQEALHTVDEAARRAEESARATHQELESLVRRTAVTIAGQLIRTAAGPLVHQSLLDQLLASGAGLTASQGDTLSRALASNGGRVTVELAMSPPPDIQVRCRAALLALLPGGADNLSIGVRVEPDLMAGGRLLAGTVAIDLSLKRTLEELAEQPAPLTDEATG